MTRTLQLVLSQPEVVPGRNSGPLVLPKFSGSRVAGSAADSAVRSLGSVTGPPVSPAARRPGRQPADQDTSLNKTSFELTTVTTPFVKLDDTCRAGRRHLAAATGPGMWPQGTTSD